MNTAKVFCASRHTSLEMLKVFAKMQDSPVNSRKYDSDVQIALASYTTDEFLRFAGRPWRIA